MYSTSLFFVRQHEQQLYVACIVGPTGPIGPQSLAGMQGHTGACSPNVTGQVVGTALVRITNIPSTLTLVNGTGEAVLD